MQEFVDFSKALASASGDIINSYFRSDFAVETKSDESPVTVADKQAEEIMREMIMKEYPAHGIIGEEFGDHNEDAEYQWVLDPIDGTKSFVSGTFLFGTLIGLMKDGQPIVGTIHHPLTSHLLIGTGDETRLNGEIVMVRPTRELRDAVMLYSDFIHIGQYQKRHCLSTVDGQNQVQPHLGRLSRLFPAGHRLCRYHVGPDHASLGYRRLDPGCGRRRRQNHLLERRSPAIRQRHHRH